MFPIKKLLSALVLLLCCMDMYGQRKYSYHTKNKKAIASFEKAVREYEARQYLRAMHWLELALKEDFRFIEAHTLAGEVAMELNDYLQAATYYRHAIGINADFFPQNFFHLARAEMQLMEFDSAAHHLELFLTYKSPASNLREKAKKLLAQCRFASYAIKHPVPFHPVNLGPGINTADDEYLPALTADEQTMVFTRRRKMSSQNRINNYNEDFYISTRDENGQWKEAANMGGPINTPGNEGAHCLTPDGHYVFFTACNRNGYRGCDLYYARRHGNQWSEPANLGRTVNSDQWDSQPSITSDGKTIYFVSSRPGGNGKQDIWKTTLDENGRFQTPVNLGDIINTEGNEMSPFIHPDNRTLFFASDGHPGMGGTDIYVSRLGNDGQWSKPFNLGYPINTPHDESSLFVSASGQTAYFATDRFENGKGRLDIWQFELYKEVRPTPVSYVKGRVTDRESGQPLDASFEIIELNSGKIVASSHSDKVTGAFLLCLPTGQDYALHVSRDGYLFHSENFSCRDSLASAYQLNVALNPIKAGEIIVLKNVFYQTAQYHLQPESHAELNKVAAFLKNNRQVKIEISGHTDSEGDARSNQLLSEKRARSVYDYLVSCGIEPHRMTAKGYGEERPVADNRTAEGRALNRRTEMMIIDIK